LTELDPLATGLIERLEAEGIPYVIIEPDPAKAVRLAGDKIWVVTGENDSRATYEHLEIASARLLIANCEDTINTNITLTAREVAAHVAIAAIVEEEDSVDILTLSGASTVLPLKRQLGEYLANRVDVGRAEAHVIGTFRGLEIAELPARDTPLSDLTVRETRLREQTGLSVVGFWQRGKLHPAFPETPIRPDTVLVVAGTPAQIVALNELLRADSAPARPVLLIGAGKVGQAAAQALERKDVKVHAIDRSEGALTPLAPHVSGIFPGEATDRRLLDRAGIARAASVLLTTNDDAMNIYLAVYCRRLNPEVRIVSRITHERNVEAIHRAGADFVLSYTTLGVEAVMSILKGNPPVLLGEGVDLFSVPVPASLAGRPLKESGIGSRTGLSVVALQHGQELVTQLTSEMLLPGDAELLMLGSAEQRRVFAETFDRHHAKRPHGGDESRRSRESH
jgi:Trk K+ transport system NAD-binding subunit